MATGAGRYRDGQVDHELVSLAEKQTALTKRTENIEEKLALDGPYDQRIKRLELWRSWVLGVGAAVLFGMGVMTSTLWNLVKSMFGH